MMRKQEIIQILSRPVPFIISILIFFIIILIVMQTLQEVQLDAKLKKFRIQQGIIEKKFFHEAGVWYRLKNYWHLHWVNPHRKTAQEMLNQGEIAAAALFMQKYAQDFGMKPQIVNVEFHLVQKAGYVMFTRRENKKLNDEHKSERKRALRIKRIKTPQIKKKEIVKFIIDINSEQIRSGLKGIDLTDVDNFRSTLNHELRHIEQYLQAVHFSQYNDEADQVFWTEHNREIDDQINRYNVLNSRMEADAYIHQLLLDDMSEVYRKMILERLEKWYLPVIAPDSQLKKQIDEIGKIYN